MAADVSGPMPKSAWLYPIVALGYFGLATGLGFDEGFTGSTSGILLAEVVIANLLHPSDRWDAGLSIAGAMLALCLAMVGTLVVTDRRSR